MLKSSSILALLLMISLSGNAVELDNDNTGLEDKNGLDEISGIIVDRTITLMGHDFYRAFTNYRQLNSPDSEYNLTVFERPSARWGSLVWIEYQSKKLFQALLSPGRSNYQEVAEQAARQIDEKLYQHRLQELLSDHIDLERDEL